MKKFTFRSLFLLAAGTLALVFTPALATAGTSLLADTGSGQRDLRSAPYEQREEFIRAVNDAVARLDARIAELNARQAGLPPSEGRARAQEDLKLARTDLESRIGALATASAETWDSVRDQALSALSRAQAAYETLQGL
jgi:phage shock protein A